MDIRFTLHAEEKLLRLAKVGITKEKVTETLKHPERVLEGYSGRKIARGDLAGDLILRLSIKGRLKGLRPFKSNLSPSPLKERGTKEVRLINNL